MTSAPKPELPEPGWKRNGRNGPLDWWLGCTTHGTDWRDNCLSCGIATDHNREFADKLEREGKSAAIRLQAGQEGE